MDFFQALIEDRIEFKFYSANQHLLKLKEFQENGENYSDTWEARVRWESEIECYLNQLMGSVDALLMRVNDKLKLKIKENKVDLGSVNWALNLMNRGDLLKSLNHLECSKGSWYGKTKELRNKLAHRRFESIRVSVWIGSDIKKVSYSNDKKNEGIVAFLEDKLPRMRKLIEDIKYKDPLLNKP
jgi:hypothetical protein